MKKTVGSLSLTAVTAAALLAAVPASAVSVKVENFQKAESPWDMAFLPDGTMFFTEKCGGLSVRTSSGGVNKLLGVGGRSGYSQTKGDLFFHGQDGFLLSLRHICSWGRTVGGGARGLVAIGCGSAGQSRGSRHGDWQLGVLPLGAPARLSFEDAEAWPFEALAWDFAPTAFLPAPTMGQALPRELRGAVHILGTPMYPPVPPYNLPPRRALPPAKAAEKPWFSPGGNRDVPLALALQHILRCRRPYAC